MHKEGGLIWQRVGRWIFSWKCQSVCIGNAKVLRKVISHSKLMVKKFMFVASVLKSPFVCNDCRQLFLENFSEIPTRV